MAIKFGRVPAPFERRIIDKPTGWRGGTRTIRGVCLHSMVGFLEGTEGFFSNPNDTGWFVLTDFGVGGSADGERDGEVRMWNDPFGERIPASNNWGSLAEKSISGDGIAFVQRYGEDAINGDLASIERSDGGDTDTPVSAKQFEGICQTAAWVVDQARIPWHVWPENNDGVKAIYWHTEFVTKDCPFPPVKTRTTAIINRVGEILKQHQEGSFKPTPPPAFDGTDKTVDGRVYHASKRTVTIDIDELNFRQRPDPSSPMTRSPMKQGRTFRVLYWVKGADVGGVDRWWVATRGHFVWSGGTAEKPGA